MKIRYRAILILNLNLRTPENSVTIGTMKDYYMQQNQGKINDFGFLGKL